MAKNSIDEFTRAETYSVICKMSLQKPNAPFRGLPHKFIKLYVECISIVLFQIVYSYARRIEAPYSLYGVCVDSLILYLPRKIVVRRTPVWWQHFGYQFLLKSLHDAFGPFVVAYVMLDGYTNRAFTDGNGSIQIQMVGWLICAIELQRGWDHGYKRRSTWHQILPKGSITLSPMYDIPSSFPFRFKMRHLCKSTFLMFFFYGLSGLRVQLGKISSLILFIADLHGMPLLFLLSYSLGCYTLYVERYFKCNILCAGRYLWSFTSCVLNGI